MTSRRILFYIIISLVFLSGCVNKHENSERIEEINQQQNYAVSLSDTSDKQFDMIFFKDGSIQFFQYTKKEIVLYLSKEKHPKLLQEIKNLSELEN